MKGERNPIGGATIKRLFCTVPPAILAQWQAKTELVVAARTASRKNGKEVFDKYRALYAEAAAERRR